MWILLSDNQDYVNLYLIIEKFLKIWNFEIISGFLVMWRLKLYKNLCIFVLAISI